MIFSSPQPRYRIYTQPSTYWQSLKEIVTNKHLQGDDLTRLIESMVSQFNTPYILPMPTARFAIYLAITAIVKPRQKVILSPLTIVDVINMVICAGGIPVFADVERNSGNISANKIAELIDKDTGAVLVTHLHGLACEIAKIKQVCQQHNIPLIEDCAQSFSTRVDNQYTGTFGTVGIFSFGMYKFVNSFYGGLLITDNQSTYEKIKKHLETLPWLSMEKYLKKILFALATDISTAPRVFQAFTYWIFRAGYLNKINWINDLVTVDRYPEIKKSLPNHYAHRMMPLQARQILKQLSHVENNNALRIERASHYYEGLKDIPEIILPPMRTDSSHLYTYYAIQVPDRHALMRFSLKKHRDWVLSHYHNCASLACFKEYQMPCPDAEVTARSLIYLPTYPRYAMDEVKKNIDVVREFFRK